jgi:hypothetical protein
MKRTPVGASCLSPLRFEFFEKRATLGDLGFGRAFVARLDLALCAFVDVPMRSRVAQIAVPEDERGV